MESKEENKKTLRDLSVEDFISSFGDSFYLEKAKEYFGASSSNDPGSYSGIKREDYGDYSILPDSEVENNFEAENISFSYEDFVQSNLLLAIDTVLHYERLLGNPSPELNTELKRIVLDNTASRIVLALGANSVAEENLIRRDRENISFYEDRIKCLSCKSKGKESLNFNLNLNNDFVPKGKSLLDPKERLLNV